MLLAPALLLLPVHHAFQDSLEKHALFGRLTLEEVACHKAIRFLVEPPKRPDADHKTSVVELYVPWVAAAAAAVENEYGIPNRLESQAAGALDVVVVGSIPTYKNAQRYDPRPTDEFERAILVDPPRVVTTRWDRSLLRAPAHELRAPVLRLVVRELLEDYRPEDTPLEPWLRSGIPEYIANHGPAATPADLAHPAPWAAALERMRQVVNDQERMQRFLIPLQELIDCAGPEEAAKLGQKHARLAGIKLGHHPYDLPGSHVFAEQSALWIHFLHQGRAGRYQETFRNYVAKALHANGGSERLARTLGVDSLDELNTTFLAHMDMLLGGGLIALPEIKLEPRATVHHAGILPTSKDLDGLRIAALARAIAGDLEAAVMELEKASLESTDAAVRESLLEEQDRLVQAQDLRRKFVASLMGSSRKLRLTRAGESVSVELKGLVDDVLYFKPGRSDLEQLPIAEVMPADVVRSMGSKSIDYGPAWVTSYLALLGNDPRWDRKLDREDAAGAALDRAVKAGLAERIQAARLHAQLLTLATTPKPSAPFEAEALLALCTQADGLDRTSELAEALWQSARPGLRNLAAGCWTFLFDSNGTEGLVSVPIKKLGDGRIRLNYEFNDPAETTDFVSADTYLAQRSRDLFDLENPESSMAVAGGEWRGRGHAVFRHPLVLQTPMRVHYEVVYGRPRPGKGLESTVLVGICDDGQENYVGAWDLFDLESIDIPSRQIEKDYEQGDRPLKSAKTYAIELRHDGQFAELLVDGESQARVKADKRTSGTFVLLVHSQITVAIRRLEIEGKLAGDAMDEARKLWVAGKVQGMGL